MLCRFFFTLIILTLLAHFQPSPALAEQLIITAGVPAKPTDFQIQITANPSGPLIGPGQIITYTATYGSYLPQTTDSIVVIISWQQDPHDPNIVDYVANSATPGLHGQAPIIDLHNKTITWTISPMPAGIDRQLTWQLLIDQHHQAQQPFNLVVNGRLIGPGVQLIANPLGLNLTPGHPITTPKPTPNQPQPSTAISPVPGQPIPSISVTPTGNPQPTPSTSQLLPTAATISNAQLTILLSLLTLITFILFLRYLQRHHLPRLFWLVLRRRTLIHGYLYRNQQPQANQQLALYQRPYLDRAYQTTITDQHGHYQFQVSPGHYVLMAISPNQQITLDQFQLTSADYGHRQEHTFDMVNHKHTSSSTQPPKPQT